MNSFFVFDNADFCQRKILKDCQQINAFSLIADSQEIDTAILRLKEIAEINVRLLNSAFMINDEANRHRDSFINWTSEIGNIRVKMKTVKEWLMLSDRSISAWWFGLLADKDPAKSPLFLRILQISAILRGFKEYKCEQIILALKDRQLQEKLKIIFENMGIKCRSMKPEFKNHDLKLMFKRRLKSLRIVVSTYTLLKIFGKSFYIKTVLPSLKERNRKFKDALLFFTYFPYLLEKDAQIGRFRNRFALPLQDLCYKNKKDIVWILMYENFKNHSFKDAVNLAKRFIKNGENIFFPFEFMNFKNLLKSFLEYIRIGLLWNKLKSELNSEIIKAICGNTYSRTFLIDALDDSFYGNYSLIGIIYYEAFKQMFKELSGFSHSLYYLEMLGWEHAAIYVQKKTMKECTVIGYQHSSFSLNHLNMFYPTKESKNKGALDDIILPDIIASNGSVPQKILERYYSKVDNIEALRYLYINEELKKSYTSMVQRNKDKFVLMVCANIELELKTFIKLIEAAYPGERDFEVWLKLHPSLDIQKILSHSEKKHILKNFEIKEEAVLNLLCQCNAVLIGASTVAIEALVFSCAVLVYLNPEVLNQSPLTGFDDYYFKVSDSKSLIATIDTLRLHYKVPDIDKRQRFVKEYWNLNPHLIGWKRILNLN